MFFLTTISPTCSYHNDIGLFAFPSFASLLFLRSYIPDTEKVKRWVRQKLRPRVLLPFPRPVVQDADPDGQMGAESTASGLLYVGRYYEVINQILTEIP